MSDQTLFPILRYHDPEAAMDWLEAALGFTRHVVHRGEDGGVAHAELAFGGALIMLGGEGPMSKPAGSGSLYAAVADPDGLFARATGAGADVAMGLTDQDYGSREFAVRDPEGNLWSFGTYRPSGD
ncbi:MAG: VOC family protein [Solirubrobacteraceae bacterium MAG38_C4-C5]|nr:VOC family protein [Candidatus Siliceabacter maunaloa]